MEEYWAGSGVGWACCWAVSAFEQGVPVEWKSTGQGVLLGGRAVGQGVPVGW